jgi:hypothetical protein
MGHKPGGGRTVVPIDPTALVQVTLDGRRRIVLDSPVLTRLPVEQTRQLMDAVQHVGEIALAPCPATCDRCESCVTALHETRHLVAATTWSLIDAVMWGARTLDTQAAPPEEVAEGLLDRLGEILSRMTGKGIGIPTDHAGSLTDPPDPPADHRPSATAPHRDTHPVPSNDSTGTTSGGEISTDGR